MRSAAWLADGVLLAVTERDTATEPGLADVLAGPLETSDGRCVLAARAGSPVSDAIASVITDLRGLLREELAHQDSDTREGVVEILSRLSGTDGLPAALAESLHVVREGLRERQPLSVIDERASRVVQVDALHRITRDEFYVRGWIWARDGDLVELSAVSPEGGRSMLLADAFRYPRPDIAGRVGADPGAPLGFACRFRTTAPSGRDEGWIFDIADAAGRGAETSVDLSPDPALSRAALVADACEEWPQADELREHHLMPALARLQATRHAATEVLAVEDFGPQVEAPALSIVVPLYERIDLLEHQLVQFADDPELCQCELIYVLDSPDQSEHLSALARELAALYDNVPFRIASLSQNGGVSIARNCGAALARGARLLFLDSDVIPARSGWLGQLSAALDGSTGVGAVAPKLVYHDGGLQHAGLAFERSGDSREWELVHRFKGLHGSLPAANDGGPVAALTGACLMADAAVYRELEGMRPMYVQGDYEDADLCLRMRESGRQCLYAPDVVLNHLEAQSYSPEARAQNRRYNRWLFTREWGETIGRA